MQKWKRTTKDGKDKGRQEHPYIGHFLDTLGPTVYQNNAKICTHACNPAQVSPTFLPLLPVSRHLSTLCGSSQRLWWHSNACQVEKFAATIGGLQKLHQQRGREDRGHPNYAAILETIADALPSERFPMRFSPGCSNHLRTLWSVLCACWLQCACVCACEIWNRTEKLCSPMHQHQNIWISDMTCNHEFYILHTIYNHTYICK